jgi:hypothetical protein
MDPTNFQTSDNQTAGVYVSHPYSQGSTTGNLPYQTPVGQPNDFNAYHLSGPSPLTYTLFESGSLQLAPSGYPQIYTSAPLFALPSNSISSIPEHLSGQHLPSQLHGHPTSTELPVTSPSSQPQFSNLYSDQTPKSIPHDPEISSNTIVSPMKSPIGDANGQDASNRPVKGNRPGRAGALKCARCRKQKRGSKVSAIRMLGLI